MLSLAAAASWGVGDFAGGIATRLSNNFVAVFLAQGALDPGTFNTRLEALLDAAPSLPDKTSGRHRLLLIGSAVDDIGFIEE